MKLGTYLLTQDLHARCGMSVFIARRGSIVKVRQVDGSNRKVVLDFGNRLTDWFSIATVEPKLELVIPVEDLDAGQLTLLIAKVALPSFRVQTLNGVITSIAVLNEAGDVVEAYNPLENREQAYKLIEAEDIDIVAGKSSSIYNASISLLLSAVTGERKVQVEAAGPTRRDAGLRCYVVRHYGRYITPDLLEVKS